MTGARRILVLDDGGFPTIKPDFTGRPIGLDPYKRLLGLAERHDLTIPIAVTACFIDVNNIAGLDSPGDQADRLVRFLLENQQRLPVWNHGLTHSYLEEFSEFAVYDGQRRVPENIQESRLEQSQAIFDDLGFARPEVFVRLRMPGSRELQTGSRKELGFKQLRFGSSRNGR